MYTYRLIETTVYDEDNEEYIPTYGIQAVRATGEIIETIEDVFLEKEKVEDLVEACNRGALDVIHLRDVVEDAIA